MKYEIQGDSLPVVVCYLEDGEQMITESGAMSWMSPSIEMQTGTHGGVGKALGRVFTGESVFRNFYTARGKGMIAFASSMPGSIRAVELNGSNSIVVQKRAFLACTSGVKTDVVFQRRFAAGMFGGEGFIMQRLSGTGIAFLEIDGSAIEYDLLPSQSMIIDTGYLAAMDDTCKMDVQSIKGVKNVLFGGEGLFNTVVTGPGHIIIQTMPLSKLTGTISAAMPQK